MHPAVAYGEWVWSECGVSVEVVVGVGVRY